MSGRKEFVEHCKKKNLDLINNKRVALIIRHKTRNGKHVGTVVAFKTKGAGTSVLIGASKCRKGDKFDRHVGIYQAIQNAIQIPIDKMNAVSEFNENPKNVFPFTLYCPLSMLDTISEVIKTIARRKSFTG